MLPVSSLHCIHADNQVYHKNFNKLTGGLANLGEDIGECASREVLEETGIETSFGSLVAFRHRHNEGIGGRSNMYFVVSCCALETGVLVLESC
eukprot:SAG31_NODE_12_length_38498_cov_21.161671_10_plen_93_part_00